MCESLTMKTFPPAMRLGRLGALRRADFRLTQKKTLVRNPHAKSPSHAAMALSHKKHFGHVYAIKAAACHSRNDGIPIVTHAGRELNAYGGSGHLIRGVVQSDTVSEPVLRHHLRAVIVA